MFPGRGCLKILAITKADIIAEVSEYRLSVLLNTSGAKSKPPFFQHLCSGNTYTPIQKARATRTQQKSPSFCGLSGSTFSIIPLLKLHTKGKHFFLLHSDKKWLKEATKTPTSPITGSFERLNSCRTGKLDTSCPMSARSCLKASASGWQPWLQGRRAGMKLSVPSYS